MSIYYYGTLVGVYNPNQKQNSEPTLVGDVVKARGDYKTYMKPKKSLVIRHFQEEASL
jgi:hypothetical protein